MKAAFGLVGILAVIGVIVWIMGKSGGALDHVQNVKQASDVAAADVRQFGGSARDGTMTFKESISVDAQSAGGKTVALLVERVDPAGPAATYYGLQRGDLITDIGPISVKSGGVITGADDGIDFLMDAYSKRQTLAVLRDEQSITLPGGATAANPGAQPATPAQPAPPKDDRGSLQRQLDNVTGAGQKVGNN